MKGLSVGGIGFPARHHSERSAWGRLNDRIGNRVLPLPVRHFLAYSIRPDRDARVTPAPRGGHLSQERMRTGDVARHGDGRALHRREPRTLRDRLTLLDERLARVERIVLPAGG